MGLNLVQLTCVNPSASCAGEYGHFQVQQPTLEIVDFCRYRRKAFNQEPLKVATILEAANPDQLSHLSTGYIVAPSGTACPTDRLGQFWQAQVDHFSRVPKAGYALQIAGQPLEIGEDNAPHRSPDRIRP